MTKQQRLPSDALTKRTSPVKVAIIAVAAVVLVGGLGTAAFAIGPSLRAGLNHPTATASAAPADTAPTLSPDELDSVQQAADAQQAQITADEAAAAQAAADAAAAQAAAQAAQSVHKCPGGTKAGAVDGAGNESNCQPLNNQGQSCQAYNDQNQCTAWGALRESPLIP